MQHSDVLQYMSFVMLASGAVAFIILLLVPSPYGRNASSLFGPPVPARIAWLVQESPSFFIPLCSAMQLLLFGSNNFSEASESLVLMIPFLIHYFQRSLIYPMLIRGGKPMPAMPFVMAFLFCTFNGYLQSSYIFNYGRIKWDMTSLLGLTLFALGMAGNVHSDHILRSLRKPGETGYKIPQGGLFNLVSGANFFAEMVEWWGFALLNRSLPSLAFAVFTMANTAPRAWHHHLWYLKKFGSKYPKNRRAIIPYLL